ncbi:MAG: hypothetical protein LBB50_02225, partial [Oscillospiraceae bacterium]|nr:hypothetical protein [Oscillospiraceae bacterium]
RARVYFDYLLRYTWNCPWGRLYRREFLAQNRLRFFDTYLRSDEDMVFTYCLFGVVAHVEFLQQPLYYYRQVAGSLTAQGLHRPEKILQRAEALHCTAQYLQTKNPALARKIIPPAAFLYIRYACAECWFYPDKNTRRRANAVLRRLRHNKTFRRWMLRAAFSRQGVRWHDRPLALCYALGGANIFYALRRHF